MNLSNCLQKYRKDRDWTQHQVAVALKVPRELISMWENGSRRPNLKQLEDIAQLFNTEVELLLGEKSETQGDVSKAKVLLRGIESKDPAIQMEVNHWLSFLDQWTKLADPSKRMQKQPPKRIDRGPDFSDIRSVTKVSAEVREFYELGNFALPDLFAFLDEQNILVCKASLGDISAEGISGAFYNHPVLGYCILINAQTSHGRQMFTLAHEFGHALFHYGANECIVSISGETSSREQFADAFAANLLVPSKGLKQFIEALGLLNCITEYDALQLASYFKVSYAFMLNRLHFDRHINLEQRDNWQKLSPRSLAKNIGLDSVMFQNRIDDAPYLSRYPASILKRVRELIEDDVLSVGQAASLLRLDAMTIQNELLEGPQNADASELKESREFSKTYGS